MNSDMSKYILEQLSKGVSSNEITKQLTNANWSKQQIDEAFQQARESVKQTPQKNSPIPPYPERSSIKTGWMLFKLSFSVLNKNPKLLSFIIISSIISIIIWSLTIGVFIFDLFTGSKFLIEITPTTTQSTEDSYNLTMLGYTLLITAYILNTIVTVYFTAALSHNVLAIFSGKQLSTLESIRAVNKKLPVIIAYSLILSAIGYVLNLIAERFKLLGRIVSYFIGAAWSLATTFSIPIIVDTNSGPFSSIKKSASLFTDNWGTTITGRASMGILVLILPFVILAIFLSSAFFGFMGLCIAAVISMLVIAVASIVTSSAQAVLNVALYYYSQYKTIPPSFSPEILSNAFVSKRK